VQFSPAAKGIKPSATLALNARARELAARGGDVINFTIGEPDFDTPDNIKQAAHLAIQAGYTKYQAAAGMPELRNAIAEKLRRDNGLDYSPEEVLVSNGAKQVLYMVLLCLVNPGDRVVISAPYWVSYVQQARICGAEPVILDATGTDELKPTAQMLERAVSDGAKVLIINSPCNPSGAVLSRQELRELVEVALAHELWVISDEIYEKLIFDGLEHVSPASFGPEARARVVTVNGLSKSYAMTGWRVGYAAGPAELIRAAAALQSHMSGGADSVAQRAAVEALTGPQDSVAQMRSEFDRRRRAMVEGLNRIPGVSCVMPGGAFYAFPDCRPLLGHSYAGHRVENSLQLCEALLEVARLAVVPGSAFGAEGYLRFHYAKSMDRIEESLERLAWFVESRDD